MGIQKYQQWLHRSFGQAFLAGTPGSLRKKIEHVYIDLNCFLHTAARRASTPAKFVHAVKADIEKLLAQFDPHFLKTVFIAVDGPAARAKVISN